MRKLIPVVMSGGIGTRLWPISRADLPKPFIKLDDGETLIKKTYRRIMNLKNVHLEDGLPYILTITNKDYLHISRNELKSAGGG